MRSSNCREPIRALDVLPALSLGNDKQAYKQKSEVKKTGTDDQPVSAYKPAYKKLTKKAYSGCQQSSINDSEKGTEFTEFTENIFTTRLDKRFPQEIMG